MAVIDRTNYNALVDDDLSNLVGTPWTKNIVKTVLLDPIDAAIAASVADASGVVQTTVLTGTQTAFPISANCRLLICNNTTLLTLQGFPLGSFKTGQLLTIVSNAAGRVDLVHQTGAVEQMKNICTSGATPLAPNVGRALYIYDGTFLRLLHHEQGAALAWTPTDASGAALTLTTANAVFILRGRQVTITARVTYPATASGAPGNIGGLPFTDDGNQWAISFGYLTYNATPITLLENGNVLGFNSNSGGGVANSALASKSFWIAGMYETT